MESLELRFVLDRFTRPLDLLLRRAVDEFGADLEAEVPVERAFGAELARLRAVLDSREATPLHRC